MNEMAQTARTVRQQNLIKWVPSLSLLEDDVYLQIKILTYQALQVLYELNNLMHCDCVRLPVLCRRVCASP